MCGVRMLDVQHRGAMSRKPGAGANDHVDGSLEQLSNHNKKDADDDDDADNDDDNDDNHGTRYCLELYLVSTMKICHQSV